MTHPVLKDYKRVLLVEPDYPVPDRKSKHQYNMPIGLLKIGTYYENRGATVKLVWLHNNNNPKLLREFNPDIIFITSLFTYWSKYVKDAVHFCKRLFPDVEVVVGGVFASLMPEVCKEYTGCDTVVTGLLYDVEGVKVNYDLLGSHKKDFDYQIIHTTRGCVRRCKYCSAHQIEKKFTYKKTIYREIQSRGVLFYDNNLLANPYIEKILEELISLKNRRQISWCEARVGVDYHYILKKPHLALMLKKAGFRYIKIAWDGSMEDAEDIGRTINILEKAGFRRSHIGVYVLFNHNLRYKDVEVKRVKIFKWGCQIINCRYIPLDSLEDNFSSYAKSQTSDDYYISPNWTDKQVRMFISNCSRTNGAILFGRKYYSYSLRNKPVKPEIYEKLKYMDYDTAKKYLSDAWDPAKVYLTKDSR